MSRSIRSRNWSLITYINDYEEVIKICNSISNILYYAIMLHDKDTDSEGAPKPLHTHIVIILRDAREFNTVVNYFKWFDKDGRKQTVLAEQVISLERIFTYLTHEDEADKYHYDKSLIKTNAEKKFLGQEEVEDKCLLIIDDLLHKVPTYEMVKRYGREFIYRYNNYVAVADRIKLERDLEIDRVSKVCTSNKTPDWYSGVHEELKY